MTRNDEVPQEVGEAIRTLVEAERALVLGEARVGPYYAGARLLHDEMLAQETARDALETVIRDHIRAKLEAAEGEVARLREDARRLDFIAPGFRILAGDHVMQCWWLETLPDGKKVARVASVPVNTPNTVRAVMDAALQEHTP